MCRGSAAPESYAPRRLQGRSSLCKTLQNLHFCLVCVSAWWPLWILLSWWFFQAIFFSATWSLQHLKWCLVLPLRAFRWLFSFSTLSKSFAVLQKVTVWFSVSIVLSSCFTHNRLEWFVVLSLCDLSVSPALGPCLLCLRSKPSPGAVITLALNRNEPPSLQGGQPKPCSCCCRCFASALIQATRCGCTSVCTKPGQGSKGKWTDPQAALHSSASLHFPAVAAGKNDGRGGL